MENHNLLIDNEDGRKVHYVRFTDSQWSWINEFNDYEYTVVIGQTEGATVNDTAGWVIDIDSTYFRILGQSDTFYLGDLPGFIDLTPWLQRITAKALTVISKIAEDEYTDS